MKLIKQLSLSTFGLALVLTCLKPYSSMAQGANTLVINAEEEKLYRPNFHFTPKLGWMNDPNGMFYAEGVYHLYFQHYPDGNVWGPMHWGHATSKDLVKWEEQPIAIYPDNQKFIFSGSAVVDHYNTSGFGDGKKAPVVAIYTLHDAEKAKNNKMDVEQQDIAYSLDNGMTFKKFDAGNPVIKNPGIRDFRDPKVSWDDKHKQWIMILAAQDRTQLYKSTDLKSWEFLSEFGKNIGGHGGVWECPDFFELKVEGTNDSKWVMIVNLNPGGPNGGSGVQYFIGDFDGKSFSLDPNFSKRLNDESGVWLDHGRDNYAGVTWNNVPQSDGRRLFIGWMSNWDYANKVPTNAWRSSTTIARELKLIKRGNEYSLVSNPVKELSNYISKSVKVKTLKGSNKVVIKAVEAIDLSKAIIEFDLPKLAKDNYSFHLANAKGDILKFGIDTNENYLFVDRSKAGITDFSPAFASSISKTPLQKNQSKAHFKIILDKTSIEIFYNNGEKVMTEIFFIDSPFTTLSVTSNNKINIENLEISQLNFN